MMKSDIIIISFFILWFSILFYIEVNIIIFIIKRFYNKWGNKIKCLKKFIPILPE